MRRKDTSQLDEGQARGSHARRLPRPETVILVLALLWTVGTKFQVIRQAAEGALLASWAVVMFPDVVFFGAFALAFALAALCRPRSSTSSTRMV